MSGLVPGRLVPEAGSRFSVLTVKLSLRPLPLCARCIYFAAVETRALFLIANNIVGGSNLLEARFRPFVVGMQVRVIFLGEPTVGLADFVLRRLSGVTPRFDMGPPLIGSSSSFLKTYRKRGHRTRTDACLAGDVRPGSMPISTSIPPLMMVT